MSEKNLQFKNPTQSFDSGKNRMAVQAMLKKQICFGKNCSYCNQHKYGCGD